MDGFEYGMLIFLLTAWTVTGCLFLGKAAKYLK